MRLLFLFCFLLLTNCASTYYPNNVSIEIDPTFTSDKKQLILESLNDWIIKTNGTFNISNINYPQDINNIPEFNIIKIINVTSSMQNTFNTPYELAGYTEYISYTLEHPEKHIQAVVYVWNDESSVLFSDSVRHELGHSFNLGHYCSLEEAANPKLYCVDNVANPKPSIMRPVFNYGNNITYIVAPIDVERFCQEWGCVANGKNIQVLSFDGGD